MLLEEDYASPEVCARVRNSFSRLAAFIDTFQPDQIIQFSPDHYHGFHYDNMPCFCVGVAAKSYGDWGTSKGQLRVDEDFAYAVLQAARSAQIDSGPSAISGRRAGATFDVHCDSRPPAVAQK